MNVIANEGDLLGECVLWCERTGRVLWTDILGARLYAHKLASGTTACWAMPERLASFALTEDNDCLLIGLASQLAFFRFSTGEIVPIAAVEPDMPTRVNDGRCDRAGNFVFGTLHEEETKSPVGAFYRLNATDLRLERMNLPGVAIANSICFSPDGATMYYCDSLSRTIRRCDYPSLAKDRLFAEVEGDGVPDGSCIDAGGFLWNAQWGGAKIVRYAPDAHIEREVAVPAEQPTCVAFGGPGFDSLLCSSATVGLAAPGPLDGALFSQAMASVHGLPESRFATTGNHSSIAKAVS